MNTASPPPPRVSVCIPTYNGASTISAAIDSVLAQDFKDFELLVVDDASPDDTAAVVGRYADPRILYVRNDSNLGPQGNWNKCLMLCRGTYFKLLPHDDLLHPSCLERQVNVMDSDATEEIALVFSAREVIGPTGRVLIRARGVPRARTGRIDRSRLLRDCLLRGTNLIGEPGAVLCRKSLADLIGPFDDTYPYVIDLDFWSRLLAHGDAYYDAVPLASFRVWRGSWSVAIGAGQSADFRSFMSKALRRHGLRATAWERFCGRWMPVANNLARLIFYRIVVR